MENQNYEKFHVLEWKAPFHHDMNLGLVEIQLTTYKSVSLNVLYKNSFPPSDGDLWHCVTAAVGLLTEQLTS